MIKLTASCKYLILKIIFYISLISGIILCISIFNPSLGGDEIFSMGLIHHSYISMLHLSYFDVHPPLYYLVLKSFLIVTTFWTKSILIKIIFAKILSIFCFIILFINLCNLLKYLGIEINLKLQLILYLMIFPTITFSMQIRMYEMAATFLSIELLYIIKFLYTDKNLYLIITVLSASFASYTHYFAAMFAGSLFLVFIFRLIEYKSWHKLYKLFYGIILFLILFIPCIPIAIRQFTYKFSNIYSSNKSNVSLLNKFNQIFSAMSGMNFYSSGAIILGIIIDCIFIYLILIINHSSLVNSFVKKLLNDIIFTFILSLIIPMFLAFDSHPIIVGRYYYPLITLCEFIILGITIYYNLINYKNVIYILDVLLLAFSMGNIFKARNQMYIVDKSSLVNYEQVKKLNHISCHVHLKNSRNIVTLESVYMENRSIKYKPLIWDSNTRAKATLGANNHKLLNHVFNNVNIHYF